MGNTNYHIPTNIHQSESAKGYISKWYAYSTKKRENTVVTLHIYGARAIFLLFNDDQDTESEYGKYKWENLK